MRDNSDSLNYGYDDPSHRIKDKDAMYPIGKNKDYEYPPGEKNKEYDNRKNNKD